MLLFVMELGWRKKEPQFFQQVQTTSTHKPSLPNWELKERLVLLQLKFSASPQDLDKSEIKSRSKVLEHCEKSLNKSILDRFKNGRGTIEESSVIFVALARRNLTSGARCDLLSRGVIPYANDDFQNLYPPSLLDAPYFQHPQYHNNADLKDTTITTSSSNSTSKK